MSKNIGNPFSANLRTLIFKIFWGSMPHRSPYKFLIIYQQFQIKPTISKNFSHTKCVGLQTRLMLNHSSLRVFIDKCLLSYSTSINPLETDVHYMTSQIVSILIDFYPDFCTNFSSFFQFL